MTSQLAEQGMAVAEGRQVMGSSSSMQAGRRADGSAASLRRAGRQAGNGAEPRAGRPGAGRRCSTGRLAGSLVRLAAVQGHNTFRSLVDIGSKGVRWLGVHYCRVMLSEVRANLAIQRHLESRMEPRCPAALLTPAVLLAGRQESACCEVTSSGSGHRCSEHSCSAFLQLLGAGQHCNCRMAEPLGASTLASPSKLLGQLAKSHAGAGEPVLQVSASQLSPLLHSRSLAAAQRNILAFALLAGPSGIGAAGAGRRGAAATS